jgi:hypothetical protein
MPERLVFFKHILRRKLEFMSFGHLAATISLMSTFVRVVFFLILHYGDF